MPDKLYGLRVSDFAHRDDLAAIKVLEKTIIAKRLASGVEEKNAQLLQRMKTLGNCVRISPTTNKKLYDIVAETCEILDYAKIPEIYSCRIYDFDVEIHGVDKPIIIVPDIITNVFDEGVQRFTIGRGITRLKSEYLKYYLLARSSIVFSDAVIPIPELVKVPLFNWMRRTELTADRGGLLACQDFPSAADFLMLKAGMPFSLQNGVDKIDYIQSCMNDNKIVNSAKKFKTLKNNEGFVNDRLIELYLWYSKGEYDAVLDKYL